MDECGAYMETEIENSEEGIDFCWWANFNFNFGHFEFEGIAVIDIERADNSWGPNCWKDIWVEDKYFELAYEQVVKDIGVTGLSKNKSKI